LAAEALGLGACPVAAFYDDELNRLLSLDGEEESVIYLAAVGAKI
ncbi:MAG: SagB/ThcOx family dehydrogenase, partial [Gammaproteobacteria bacterium]|nr:SagB/ThcOx family dehydrogenase [Gammaproteobacteria bacterium]